MTYRKSLFASRRHRGVSIWRDHYDRGHWLIILPFRWIFHVYDWREPRRKHFYLIRRPRMWQHINEPHAEFERKPL